MDTRSLWHGTAQVRSFPRLGGERATDVLVVGAGIAGLTAGLLLQRAGREVVIVESRRVGAGETGSTTAHLTEILDTRYHALQAKHGREAALAAAESSRAAIAQIESLAAEIGDACRFARVPGYLFATGAKQRSELERELSSLKDVGADAGWADEFPFPIPNQGAIRIDAQAQFHPLAYLSGLVERFVAAGGRIYENTMVRHIEDGSPCQVTVDGGALAANQVLVLTNAPISTRVALHTKIAAYRTYAIAGPADPGWRAGLLWDLEDPYHYIRTQSTDAGKFLVVGGEDHKTGQRRRTIESFDALERYAHSTLGLAQVTHRWSGQILEPVDGLPLIGQSAGSHDVYIATGFSGNGMTFGTLAAMILADAALGRTNRWSRLYDPTRIKPLAQAAEYVAENIDFPSHLIRDRLSRGEVSRFDQVQKGEGRLARVGGKMLAVSRDQSGALHVRSAACTHLGCYVHWNQGEQSWDCPCHGSRFSADGQLINGPATRNLDEPELHLPAESPPV